MLGPSSSLANFRVCGYPEAAIDFLDTVLLMFVLHTKRDETKGDADPPLFQGNKAFAAGFRIPLLLLLECEPMMRLLDTHDSYTPSVNTRLPQR